MKINLPPDQAPTYLDFSGFQELKRQSRSDKDAALQSTARQLESVFLNMMLQSMRAANAGFSEGNYLTGRDSEFYQDMYDRQLGLNLANGRGIGLADMIVKQMTPKHRGKEAEAAAESAAQPTQTSGFALPEYRVPARDQSVQASSDRSMREATLMRQLQRMEFAAAMDAPEAALFSPQVAQAAMPSEAEFMPEADLYLNAPDAQETWNTPEEFVNCIWPHAQRAGREMNVDPQAIVAQAVLETGWGQRQIKDAKGNNSFNLFGIKAGGSWEGDVARKRTLEYRNGIAATETASFRSYGSLREAFDDYVRFLTDGSRYQGVFEQAKDAKQWGYALQKAGYATDPKYGNKIASIMESDILQTTSNTEDKSL